MLEITGGELKGGSEGSGPRNAVGTLEVSTGGSDATGGAETSRVGSAELSTGVGVGSGTALPNALGDEVPSLSVGAGVSPTGSGVMFIIVGMGVGRMSTGLGVSSPAGAGVAFSYLRHK
jgi:hypothetical protein